MGKQRKSVKKMKKKVVSKEKGRGKVSRERKVKGIVGEYKVGRWVDACLVSMLLRGLSVKAKIRGERAKLRKVRGGKNM